MPGAMRTVEGVLRTGGPGVPLEWAGHAGPSDVTASMRGLPGTPIRMLCTDAGAGDQRHLLVPPGHPGQLPDVPGVPIYGVRQVHGAGVLVVPGCVEAGVALWEPLGDQAPEGDAVVARRPGRAVTVLTADCVPLVVGAADGTFAAVHVGWRGLVAGVVEAVAETLARLQVRDVVATLGPAIGPCCYDFSPGDVDVVARRAGGAGVAVTRSGRPALDLPAAVRAVAQASGMNVIATSEPCTACSGRYFSFRARNDQARQATVVWCEAPGGPDEAEIPTDGRAATRPPTRSVPCP